MAARRKYITDQQKEIDKAMYSILVIEPLVKIIEDLNGNFTYRLDFLEEKLAAYMKTAAATVGVSPTLVQQSTKPEIKNQFARDYYLKYFNGMLNHFSNL